jgi:hypothetical protein
MGEKSILEQGFEAQAKSLVEFGYSGITAEMIETAHGKWQRGDEPEGVIEMFSFRAFDDHPEIFGKPAA